MERQPFKRIAVLVAGANAALAALNAATLERGTSDVALTPARESYDYALAKLMGYTSRGHGGKHRKLARSCLSRTLADRSIYQPADEDRKHIDVPKATRALLRRIMLGQVVPSSHGWVPA